MPLALEFSIHNPFMEKKPEGTNVNDREPILRSARPADEPVERARLYLYPPGELKCVWMSAGLLDYRLCSREGHCEICPFDQAMRMGRS
jgi:hypothetical protein